MLLVGNQHVYYQNVFSVFKLNLVFNFSGGCGRLNIRVMLMNTIHAYDEMYRFIKQKFHINNINMKCTFVINIQGGKDVF